MYRSLWHFSALHTEARMFEHLRDIASAGL
jgi:hypothetical protein